MPGETISLADLDSLYAYKAAADKYPKYHVSIVSKTQKTQGGGATMLAYALSNKFNVLLSDKKEDSGHEDNAVVGMLWEHYNQIKAHTRKQANESETNVSHIGVGATLKKTAGEPAGAELFDHMPYAEGVTPEAPPVEASEE